jgi:PhnB protein
MVQFKPDGYHSITPYLIIRDAGRAIDWYKTVFGAEEIMRMAGPDGKIGHAELKIGDTIMMLGDEGGPYKSPQALGDSPIGLMLYVKDVDVVFHRAMQNGARQKQALENKFYGDRSGGFYDPFGHSWMVSTHIEDVTPEEMEKRMAALPEMK